MEKESGGEGVDRKSTVLIAGASGLVGQAAARHFASIPGWHVVTVSRRRPSVPVVSEWLPLDLGDTSQCIRLLSSRSDITHIVYAALHEVDGLSAGWFDEQVMHRNELMLSNLMEPLLASSPIEHVSLMQGTKAYGMHHPSIGWSGVKNPLPRTRRACPSSQLLFFTGGLPARAAEGRLLGPHHLSSDGRLWRRHWHQHESHTGTRQAWAALLRDEGRALDFPGRHVSATVKEAVDADLVARALAWAARCPDARGGTYNLTNGDVFLWRDVWSVIAEVTGMAVGEHRHVQLATEIPRRAEQWSHLVDRFDLRAPRDILAFVGSNSLVYADTLLVVRIPLADLS